MSKEMAGDKQRGPTAHEQAANGWIMAGQLIEKCLNAGIDVEISPAISEKHIASVHAGDAMRDVSDGCPVPLWQSLTDVCTEALTVPDRLNDD